jgi:two-component sensor histidine kinase
MSTSSRDKDQMERRDEHPGATDGVDLLLKNDRGAAFAARQVVLSGNGLVPAPVRDEVLLMVSELVTNAFRHAGMGADRLLRVELRRWSGLVGLAVIDEGTGFTPDPRSFRKDESGGWGLFLVDRIANRWGVVPTTAGTRVWAEISFNE